MSMMPPLQVLVETSLTLCGENQIHFIFYAYQQRTSRLVSSSLLLGKGQELSCLTEA